MTILHIVTLQRPDAILSHNVPDHVEDIEPALFLDAKRSSPLDQHDQLGKAKALPCQRVWANNTPLKATLLHRPSHFFCDVGETLLRLPIVTRRAAVSCGTCSLSRRTLRMSDHGVTRLSGDGSQ